MKLGDWMNKRDVSAEVLAEQIGVDPVTVRRYVAGTRRPNWDVMPRIVEVTKGEVTPNDFLDRRPAVEAFTPRVVA